MGTSRFVGCRRPGAVDEPKLGTVEQALAAEQDEVRLRLDPSIERLRPLARSPQVEDPVARLDDGAVDHAGDQRRHLAGRDRDHRLVQDRHAGRWLARADERLTQPESGEGREVRVVEAFGERPTSTKVARALRPVAGVEAGEGTGQQQISVLDRLRPAFEQMLRSRQPTTTARRLTAAEEREAEPERRPSGSDGVTLVERLLVRARQDVARSVIAPEKVRRRSPPAPRRPPRAATRDRPRSGPRVNSFQAIRS